jgi:hypothetical protein
MLTPLRAVTGQPTVISRGSPARGSRTMGRVDVATRSSSAGYATGRSRPLVAGAFVLFFVGLYPGVAFWPGLFGRVEQAIADPPVRLRGGVYIKGVVAVATLSPSVSGTVTVTPGLER